MKGRPVHERIGFALAGLRAAYARESSFRIHVRTLIVTVVVLLLVRPAAVWWGAIALAAALIFALEMVNSALEGVVDLLHPGQHPEIGVAKDMASAAVLVAGLGAIVVAVCAVADTWPRIVAEAQWLMVWVRGAR